MEIDFSPYRTPPFSCRSSHLVLMLSRDSGLTVIRCLLMRRTTMTKQTKRDSRTSGR